MTEAEQAFVAECIEQYEKDAPSQDREPEPGRAMIALTEIEQAVVAKLVTARFAPYSAAKRFSRDLESGYVKQLSDKGREFLAYIVHRYRRQYRLSEAEQAWVTEWLARHEQRRSLPVAPKPVKAPEPEPLTEADLWGETL